MPLRYLKAQIDIKAVEEMDPECESLVARVFGKEPIRYQFDTQADMGKTENLLEKEIKKKIRTIMLYDALYKMKQE